MSFCPWSCSADWTPCWNPPKLLYWQNWLSRNMKQSLPNGMKTACVRHSVTSFTNYHTLIYVPYFCNQRYTTGNPQKSQVYEKHSNSCKMNEGRLSACAFRISDLRIQNWDFRNSSYPNRCFAPQHDKGNTSHSDGPIVMLDDSETSQSPVSAEFFPFFTLHATTQSCRQQRFHWWLHPPG